MAAALLGGQVMVHLLSGKIHRRNTLDQMAIVGTGSLFIAIVAATFIGMGFSLQISREFSALGASGAVGGVLSVGLARELAPLLTAGILTGRVGSAFAAEIGTMRVTEQVDALYMLRSDPIDYLVIPRVIACCLMLPVLTLFSYVAAMLGAVLVADGLFNITAKVFLDSAQTYTTVWDLTSALLKAFFFGALIAIIGSSWGLTTTGGAKGVGQSTTTAVVTSLLAIVIADFFLTWIMFQGVSSTTAGGG